MGCVGGRVAIDGGGGSLEERGGGGRVCAGSVWACVITC